MPGKGRASPAPNALTSGHVFRRVVKSVITLDNFKTLDIRVGTVQEASPAPDACLPGKQIGKYKGPVLMLGAYAGGGAVPLLTPGRPISNGTRLK